MTDCKKENNENDVRTNSDDERQTDMEMIDNHVRKNYDGDISDGKRLVNIETTVSNVNSSVHTDVNDVTSLSADIDLTRTTDDQSFICD